MTESAIYLILTVIGMGLTAFLGSTFSTPRKAGSDSRPTLDVVTSTSSPTRSVAAVEYQELRTEMRHVNERLLALEGITESLERVHDKLSAMHQLPSAGGFAVTAEDWVAFRARPGSARRPTGKAYSNLAVFGPRTSGQHDSSERMQFGRRKAMGTGDMADVL